MASIEIDLDENQHTFFVLSDALKEWSARLRGEAEDGAQNAELFTEWADTADRLRERIEDAHYGNAQ